MLKLSAKFDMGDVIERLEQAKQASLDEIGKDIISDYQTVAGTYEQMPNFRAEKHEDYHAVGTDDEKFVKNNDGHTRYVRLSEDYERKTQPGVIASFPGAGRVVGFTPFGIEVPAGNWDEAIAESVAPAVGPIAKQQYLKLFPGG